MGPGAARGTTAWSTIINAWVETMATHHIDEYTEGEVQRESLWKRALIMIGFMIALGIGLAIVHLIAIFQLAAIALNKKSSNALGEFGGSLALWMRDVAAYQCMASDDKPFPWQPWPEVPVIDGDDEAAWTIRTPQFHILFNHRLHIMYKHLLIAIDGSDLAQIALHHGIALAKALDAKVTIVTVSEPWHAYAPGETAMPFPVKEYQESIAKWATDILATAKTVAGNAGVNSAVVHIKDDYPADGILGLADKQDCDLIVMASHGRRGLSRMVLGSQANHVVTHSNRPVLICRG
jgi:nucleotide-binding universal stress UspA family protein